MAEQQNKAQGGLPLNESPEFKAALAAAVAQEIAKLAPAGDKNASSDDMATMGSLALALAELTGQGQGKTFVDPKVLKARRAAEDRMWELIVEAHRAGKIATYQLTRKVVLADELVEPFWIDTDHTAKPTVIDWAGAPNDAMVPINDVAKEIHEQFKLSTGLGETTRLPRDTRALGITPGGLTVYGAAVPKRRGDAGRNPQHGESVTGEFEKEHNGLNIRHKHAPGQQAPVHILGTIAPPAQEITSQLGRP